MSLPISQNTHDHPREMNASITQSFRNDGATEVSEVDKTANYGIVGVVIQILMMYIITRDLLMTSSFLNHYAPILGTIQARLAVALLIGWIALSTRGLGTGFGGFRHWGWVVLGPFGIMVLVEGLVTITAGTNSKPIVVVGINLVIFLVSVGSAYLFAIRRRTSTQALRFLIQPYLYLSITVSVLGLAAWLLVHVGGVDPADWYLPDQFAAGRVADDSRIGYYSSPYYLSGILNQSNGQLLNFNFNRAAGLFEEPALAAFFVAPAIFLMPLIFRRRSGRLRQKLGILTIFAFLLVVNSTTNFFIMIIIGSLVLSRVMFTHPRSRARALAATALVVLGALAWLTIANSSGVRSEFRSVGTNYASNLSRSLEEGSLLGPGIVEPARDEKYGKVAPRGLLSWAAVLFHIGIVGALGIRMIVSRSTHWYVGGALIYLSGHSMKSFGHTATTGYYLYILVVLALSLACYWGISHSGRQAVSQGRVGRGPAYPSDTPVSVLPN
jgi:hypothetical protein